MLPHQWVPTCELRSHPLQGAGVNCYMPVRGAIATVFSCPPVATFNL
jgi:hypothetical protein